MLKLRIIVLLAFFALPAFAQVEVRGEYQPALVRGATAVVTVAGLDLPGVNTRTLVNWPTEMNGIRVMIEGTPCPIRGMAKDSIVILVPTSLSRRIITRWFRKETYTVAVITPATQHTTEINLTSVSPGLIAAATTTAEGEKYPIGLWRIGLLGTLGVVAPGQPIHTEASQLTTLQVWGSGARWASLWGGVTAIIRCAEIEARTPVRVEPLGTIDGIDAFTFELPAELSHAGKCYLQIEAANLHTESRVLEIK